MEWLAENAQNGYVLLGFAAFMLAGVWWIQKQIIYLVGAGAALVALLVFWLVIRNVPTTAIMIEEDLKSLAQALLDKDEPKAFRFVAESLKYKGKKRDKWFTAIQELIVDHQIDAIHIKDFSLKKHARGSKEADVDFHLEARHKGNVLYQSECPWEMKKSGDAWQVTKVSLRKASIAKGSKKDDADED